jgi:hypothetical protein
MTALVKSRAFRLVLLAAVTALHGPASPVAAVGQSRGASSGDRDLEGAIDMHVHTIPDSQPWRVDSIEAAKLARSRGMRGLVLKSHWEPTATIAYLVRKEVPGIEVFGGIDLSRAVGGINPAAVEEMTKITGGFGRVVWMPTLDAENVIRASNSKDPFVRISQRGELLPEVKEVISVIAKHGLVLATGHSSAEEGLMLVREGHRQGVQHMVVTHAMSRFPHMTITQMKAAAKEGAFIELVYVHTLTIPELGRTANFTIPEAAEAIRQIGAVSVVLATDMGQVGIPLPVDGLARFAAGLRGQGLTNGDLDRMMKENPARLLGLPVPRR